MTARIPQADWRQRGRPRKYPERAIQIAIADWCAVCMRPPPEGPIYTAINPMPGRNDGLAGLATAMGLVAGWPDIILLWQARLIGFEVKKKGGTLSDSQKDLKPKFILAGGLWYTVDSYESFRQAVEVLGIPHRECAA